VSRLRDGAKITTGTLDKVRAYLSEHPGASPAAASHSSAAVKPMNGAAAAPAGFRFFDNRQKYLLFVSTCSEKTEVANRIWLELGICSPLADCARPAAGCAVTLSKPTGQCSKLIREPCLKTRKAALDCRPGSFCGLKRPAPIPGAG
jgi:hypothetical protein